MIRKTVTKATSLKKGNVILKKEKAELLSSPVTNTRRTEAPKPFPAGTYSGLVQPNGSITGIKQISPEELRQNFLKALADYRQAFPAIADFHKSVTDSLNMWKPKPLEETPTRVSVPGVTLPEKAVVTGHASDHWPFGRAYQPASTFPLVICAVSNGFTLRTERRPDAPVVAVAHNPAVLQALISSWLHGTVDRDFQPRKPNGSVANTLAKD